jgi:hypothetical protein
LWPAIKEFYTPLLESKYALALQENLTVILAGYTIYATCVLLLPAYRKNAWGVSKRGLLVIITLYA